MRRIWDGNTFEPYHPWPLKRKLKASIAARKRIALKKKEELEALIKELNWQEELLDG